MDRPNRNERIKMQDEYFNKYNDKSYLQALEKYANRLEEQLLIHSVSQAKRTVCPDCGDYGWIYSEDGTSRKTCPCHY